ncbi:MAG: glycerol-3-phosphate acyltransferase [Chloroflexi bacterium]|jgi:acyl phosphate:glycerol-3-phosphate acyltransferase|nr:glycerol-3-phosphate acyltransferase [Chloroflexota bacterium]MBT4002580.1 glycerol-3-phosphate acyltransferase [Chloroflexota bacterium]MBT4305910.1 glycerol-3-phosphate acyltransferase [Chloroflexota bacterium]MBT4533735.1 glycerol-3-phosphate acyltransferase [Chloroflexota bacterium]MBT4681622.1 glycerol-3-phosphate acyltransferase [Chloroflexota bacterium]
MEIITGALIVGLGYMFGSLTFSIWITKYLKNVDVRDSGSKHATTTNTIRQAGFFAGSIVLVLDILKGFIPTYLAITFGPDWSIPLTATFAVIGHCWPIFAEFRGGMGLATAGGALIAIMPISFLVALAVLIVLTLVIKHSARAAMVFGFLLPFILYILNGTPNKIYLGIGMGVVLIFRFYSDYNRKYRELWLDRDVEDGKV